MKNILIPGIALMLLFSACQEKETPRFKLTGEITNHEDKYLKLFNWLGKSDWIEYVDVVDNQFEWDTLIEQPMIKDLMYNMSSTSIYMEPGKSVHVNFEADQVDSTLSFSGDLIKENIALNKVMKTLQSIDYQYAYTQAIDLSAKHLDSLENIAMDILNTAIEEDKLSSNFKDFALSNLKSFIGSNRLNIGQRKDSLPAGYYAFLENFDFENESYLDVPHYRMFLYSYHEMLANEKLSALDSTSQAKPDAEYNAMLATISEIEDAGVKDYALFNTVHYKLQTVGANAFDQYYDYFKKHNTDPYYKAELDKILKAKEVMATGQPAPKFELNDVNGQKVALDDFKGQYVYLDFWQTLCPRSSREMPHLLKLHEDYKDKNISFVSISVNEDIDVWKNFVNENRQMGKSLRTPHSFDGQVYRDYQINGLPSFVLIDPEGKIVDPVAAKPSSDEIRKQFDSILQD